MKNFVAKKVVDLKKLCCDKKKLTRSKQGKRKRSSSCATRGYFNCNTRKAPSIIFKRKFFFKREFKLTL
jgi:hypothetical protein